MKKISFFFHGDPKVGKITDNPDSTLITGSKSLVQLTPFSTFKSISFKPTCFYAHQK